MYKAIIFDMDGTLVHTSPEFRYIYFTKTFAQFGKTVTKEFMDRMWFRGGRDEILTQMGIPFLEFWKKFAEHTTLEVMQQYLSPYADTDMLPELKAQYKTGVVSGAPQKRLRYSASLLGTHNFDTLISASETYGIRAKPHPQGVYACLDELGVKTSEAVLVGNSDEDILAAQAAGVLDVLVDRGEYQYPELNPTVTIKTIYQLRHIL